MRKLFTVGLLFVLNAILALGAPNAPYAVAGGLSPLDPAVATALGSAATSQQISVIVTLSDQADVRLIHGRDFAESQRLVAQALHAKADGTQVPLKALLSRRQAEGRVQAFKPLWIVNGIALTADSTVINEISRLPFVKRIELDSAIQAPTPILAPSPIPATKAPAAPEANINLVNAPAMWNLGYWGQGIVIASMDTGVDMSHADISARWRGGANSWFDPYGQHATPTDVNGHGTWSTSILVGGSDSGTAIGIAPQAKWIAAKIFNDSDTSSMSAIHNAYQWLLDPDGNPLTPDAPNIVNNSWTFTNFGCNLEFEPDLQALVAAGITPVFAAGNFGPNGSTDTSPANNPNAFSVGAVDNANLVASFSSKGPTSCGRGAAVAYPAVVAPGVNVLADDLYGGYFTVSGTSFAAPHVSGALALLLSAYPTLTVTQQELALASSAADLGANGLDNTYGAGRIDVLAAYNALSATVVLTPSTWYVTTIGDGELDGNVATRRGSLRFALAHATDGDFVSFDQLDAAVDVIDVASTLVVSDGVAVGHMRNQACSGANNPLINIRAQAAVTQVFRLGARSTLRDVDIAGGTISVKANGDDVDVCGVGLGYLHDATEGLVPFPPATAAFTVDGARAVLHQSEVNGGIIISPLGSDTRIGDAIPTGPGTGIGDDNHGACGNQGKCPVSILASLTGAAQRVTVRDPFPRSLYGLVGDGILGGDDVVTHTNHWAQTPVITSALSFDGLATVVVMGTANPYSLVDVYFDDLITLAQQAPVVADASGTFTFTGVLSGAPLSVFVVSTLSDTAHLNRVGSSSQWSGSQQVVNVFPSLQPRVWLPDISR